MTARLAEKFQQLKISVLNVAGETNTERISGGVPGVQGGVQYVQEDVGGGGRLDEESDDESDTEVVNKMEFLSLLNVAKSNVVMVKC